MIERLAAIAPKTLRGRTRTPALMRNHAKMAIEGPAFEIWKLGYLIDTIYFRDLWMHRVDVSHAMNRPMDFCAEHDGRIVADVVAEWGRRHGQSFALDLTGPAGGAYTHNQDFPEAKHISIDAVEFCRTLAGRQPASGLLATVVPF